MTVLKPPAIANTAVGPFRFSAARPVALSEAPVTTDVAISREQALEEAVAALSRRLEEQAAAHEEALARTRSAALEEGRAAATSSEADRVAVLREASAKALALAGDQLAGQCDLAIAIARAALVRILGDETLYPRLVADTVARWKDQLATGDIVALRVSAKDFTDPAMVAGLQDALPGVAVTALADLAPGSCLFDLRLGALDASIPLQAAEADALLQAHGGGAAA